MSTKEIILPKEVESNIDFLKEKNVWHILSKNQKVVTCKDAAYNRIRLGNKGIPIFDELKSELGFFINKENQKQEILVHCRGNQKLDRLKISSILNSEYRRITSVEYTKGLINPFGKKYRNLHQIFDISTTRNFYPPYTMMTNAGDYEYAIEFEVNSLINALKCRTQIHVEDIIRNDNYNSYKRHKIGILTGNGPDSGILLWKKINEDVKTELKKRLEYSFKGDLSYPEIIVKSMPDMGISMELDKRLKMTEKIVMKSILDLCQNDVTIVCIACNTTQYFSDKVEELCCLHNVEFISMHKVVDSYLQEKNIKKFDFIGLSHVVDFGVLSKFNEFFSKYTIPKLTTTAFEKINEIAFISKKDINRARSHLIPFIKSNTKYDTVVFALTEISTILAENKDLVRNKVVVDSLQLLANHIASIYVSGIFETLYVNDDKEHIEIKLLNEEEKEQVKNELWNILCEINYEFVPPLSSRDSTTIDFNTMTNTNIIEMDKPQKYFDEVIKQEIIISRKKSDNQVIGFMSFRPNYTITIENESIVCHYISTLGVLKSERGQGIANQFYKKIEEIATMQNAKIIATRTWGFNKTHINLLLNSKYKSHVIKNDRGPGIDTVYLTKDITILEIETTHSLPSEKSD